MNSQTRAIVSFTLLGTLLVAIAWFVSGLDRWGSGVGSLPAAPSSVAVLESAHPSALRDLLEHERVSGAQAPREPTARAERTEVGAHRAGQQEEAAAVDHREQGHA